MSKPLVLIAVIARVPVDFNGERFEPGSPLEVPEKDAQALLAVSAVEIDLQAHAAKAEAAANSLAAAATAMAGSRVDIRLADANIQSTAVAGDSSGSDATGGPVIDLATGTVTGLPGAAGTGGAADATSDSAREDVTDATDAKATAQDDTAANKPAAKTAKRKN